MRKILSVVISSLLAAQIIAPAVFAETAAQIYVSAAGTASGSGDEENPVDIKTAMQMAKQYSGGDVEVLLMGGRYELGDTIAFTSANSAADGCSITYRPYNDEEVIFTGAKQLSADGFKNVTDAELLKRIPQAARSKVMALELADYGLSYSISDSTRPYLYVDNVLQTTARYPNGSLLKAANASGTESFSFNDYDISAWSEAEDAVLAGSTLSTFFWRNLKMSVSGNIITASDTVRKNAEFYVENLLEELDIPGEYFVDRTKNVLYYYPARELDENTVIEITSLFKTAITMQSCANVTFDGLTFEKMGSNAFYINGAENITIKNCNINFIQGSDAIYLKGSNSQILDNSFYGCANNVIEFHGGTISTLTEGNILVKNNRISNSGYRGRHSIIYSGNDSTSAPADYGNKIYNNIIQDCMTFMGIVCNANDYEIMYNEIVNPGYLIGDGGAIYMGKSNVKYGMEVAYNYIHDGHKGNSSYAYCGLYSDDGYSGNNYHHNVVRDMYQGMIVGVGMNSKFNNNLFINNSKGSYVQSRMTNYSSSAGATESGYQSMMYNEANTIKEKAVYADKFLTKYPLIDEALTRKPYFAPWNTEVTGNILIGENAAISKPWHPYYRKSSTDVVIENEDTLVAENSAARKYGKKYIGSVTFNGYYIDELSLYGAEITDSSGNDLNGTSAGNPQYDYDESYFKDAANQDYTLTQSLSAEISSADEIDMSKIGIVSTSNESIFDRASGVTLVYPQNNAVCDTEIDFNWQRVKNASKYTLTVADNEALQNPVIETTLQDMGQTLVSNASFENGKTYYWNVKAHGLVKGDSFELTSDTYIFTTVLEGTLNTESLEYALSVLDLQLNDYVAGKIDYTDTAIYNELSSLSQSAHTLVESAALQTEIDECENTILDSLITYKDSIVYAAAEITSCVADKNSDNVYVTASGFDANTLVGITVTNPLYDLSAASEGYNLESIQYSDTLLTDSNGGLTFTFNTRVNNEDRSGIYTVYMAEENGRVISKSYCYETVSAGELKYTNSDNQPITDLSAYDGKEITMSCNIWNGTSKSFTPAIINAFYATDGSLERVQINEAEAIAPQTNKELSWKVEISTAGEAKVLFFHSLASLKPFEKCRIIYEAAQQ